LDHFLHHTPKLGIRVGNFGKVGVGHFGKVGVEIGHFTSDSAEPDAQQQIIGSVSTEPAENRINTLNQLCA